MFFDLFWRRVEHAVVAVGGHIAQTSAAQEQRLAALEQAVQAMHPVTTHRIDNLEQQIQVLTAAAATPARAERA